MSLTFDLVRLTELEPGDHFVFRGAGFRCPQEGEVPPYTVCARQQERSMSVFQIGNGEPRREYLVRVSLSEKVLRIGGWQVEQEKDTRG